VELRDPAVMVLARLAMAAVMESAESAPAPCSTEPMVILEPMATPVLQEIRATTERQGLAVLLATLVRMATLARMAPMVLRIQRVPTEPMVSMVSLELLAPTVLQVLLEQALRTEPKAPMVHRVRSAWDPMTSAMLVIRVRPVVLATKVPQALTESTVLRAPRDLMVSPDLAAMQDRTATQEPTASMVWPVELAVSVTRVSLEQLVMQVLTVMQARTVPLVSPVDPVVPTVSMVSAESVWSAWVTPR